MLITTSKEQDMQEKVLAEAKLAEDRGIRVVRDEEAGDYRVEWLEPGNTWRSVPQPTNLNAAMGLFMETVVNDEIATVAMEYGVRVS